MRQAAVLIGFVLLCAGPADARREPAIPVDLLPGHVCDASRLPEEPVLYGRLQWLSVECLESDASGYCRRCRGEPVLTQMDLEASWRTAFQLPPMVWEADPDPKEGIDCTSRRLYGDYKPHTVHVRLPDDLPSWLFAGTATTVPPFIPVMLMGLPQPSDPALPKDAMPVAEVWARACRFPAKPLRLRGTLQMGPVYCTEASCPGECCNTCGGQPVLAGQRIQVALEGIQCSGTDCGMTCPGLQLGTVYDVTGILRRERGIPTLRPSGPPVQAPALDQGHASP